MNSLFKTSNTYLVVPLADVRVKGRPPERVIVHAASESRAQELFCQHYQIFRESDVCVALEIRTDEYLLGSVITESIPESVCPL